MPVVTRLKSLRAARQLVEDGIANGTLENVNIVILPPENQLDSDQEDIDEEKQTPDIPAEVAGELEIQDAEYTSKKRKRGSGAAKPKIVFPWEKVPPASDVTYPVPIQDTEPEKLISAHPELMDLSPYQLFKLFLTDNALDLIVDESIRYAVQQNEHFYTVTAKEIEQFLGVVLYSGYAPVPYQRCYWEKGSPDFSFPLVTQCFSRLRFETIKKYFHLAYSEMIENEPALKADKFAKIRPLANMLNARLKQFGIFSCELSIDEQIVPYYGHHSAKMCMLNKPVRFGYELHWLCSSKGYPYHFEFYGGKDPNCADDTPLSTRVVNKLLSCVDIPSDHKVYFDNWFASASLMDSLSERNFKATATVRDNRLLGCPLTSANIFKKEDRGAFEVFQTERVVVCRWNDNKPVRLISNFDSILPLQTVERWCKKGKKRLEVTQPKLIKGYNNFMGGVDAFDRACSEFRPMIRRRKWYWPLVLNMINTGAVAAWRIYREIHKGEKDVTQIQFLRTLVIELLKCETPRKATGPRSTGLTFDFRYDGVNHIPNSVRKQGLCVFCKKSKSSVQCAKCGLYLHRKKCFEPYHAHG